MGGDVGRPYLVLSNGNDRIAISTDAVVTVGATGGDAPDLSEHDLGLSFAAAGRFRDIAILSDTTTVQLRVGGQMDVETRSGDAYLPLPESFFGRTPYCALLALGGDDFALVLHPQRLSRFKKQLGEMHHLSE